MPFLKLKETDLCDKYVRILAALKQQLDRNYASQTPTKIHTCSCLQKPQSHLLHHAWNITESKLFLAGCVVREKCSRSFVLPDVALLYTYPLLYWRDRAGLEIWGLRDGGQNCCWVQLHQCDHRIKVFQPNFTYLLAYAPQIQLQHLVLAHICDL